MDKLKVSEIFYSIQGEGCRTGQATIFVRLQGCNMRCDFCDTVYAIYDETDSYKTGYLKGIRYGDGCVSSDEATLKAGIVKKYPNFSVENTDLELLETVQKYIKQLFGLNTKILKIKLRPRCKQSYSLTTYKKEIIEKIDCYPNNIEEERGFIAGFWDSEGSLSYDRSSNFWVMSMSNTNKYLIALVEKILINFRFVSKSFWRKNNENKGYKDCCDLVINSNRNRWDYKESDRQRFFDVFQPKISSKYKIYKKRWQAKLLSVKQIVAKIKKYPCQDVCLTGGSPLFQNIKPLVEKLKELNYRVQIETNGSLELNCKVDCLTVSPKELFRNEYLTFADEIKWVVKDKGDINKIKALMEDINGYIYLQPVDTNKKVLKMCVEEIKKNPRFRLSPQIHKIIGVR